MLVFAIYENDLQVKIGTVCPQTYCTTHLTQYCLAGRVYRETLLSVGAGALPDKEYGIINDITTPSGVWCLNTGLVIGIFIPR